MAAKPSTSASGIAPNAGSRPAGDAGAAGGEGDLSNEQLLAELNAERAGGKPGKGTVAVAVEELEDDGDDDLDDDDSDEDDEDGDGGGDDEDDDSDEDADDEDDEDSSTDGDPDSDEDKDPETAKRMAALRRTEQRQRQALERERATFDRERSEFETERKELRQSKETFDKLAARAKYDSYSVLRALGIPDEDMEYHAQQLAARSPKYAAKPEYRAAADRAMKDRESSDATARALSRVDELEKSIKDRDEQVARDRDAEIYMTRVARKVTDQAPLTKSQLARNPARAREGLARVALQLATKRGQMPKAAEVVARYEKRLARELRELGLEAPAGKATSAAAKGDKAASKPAGKKTDSKEGVGVEVDRGVNGAVYHPSHEELLEEIRAGKHLE